MHSYQMCFQSSTENRICIAFGGVTLPPGTELLDSFENIKYCCECFPKICSKSRMLPGPGNQCTPCTACRTPHWAPRKRQSHKVDVVTRMHKFASILTILFSLNHLFPKRALMSQHLSATTLIRSDLYKKGNFYCTQLAFTGALHLSWHQQYIGRCRRNLISWECDAACPLSKQNVKEEKRCNLLHEPIAGIDILEWQWSSEKIEGKKLVL